MRIRTAIFLLLLPLSANAQITLEQCQEKARNHYPEIAQYDLISQSEEYSLSSAARCWIPQITVNAQATWQNAVASYPEQLKSMLTAATGTEIPGLSKDQYKVGVDVSQTIWDGGVSKAQKAQAKAEAQEQRLSSDVDIYALESRVNDVYFGMILLDESYGTFLSKKELLEKNEAKLESMVRNGLALKSDLDLVKVEELSLGQMIDQNRASRASFQAMLELLIGEPLDGRTLQRPAEVPVLNLGNNRPELQMIDAKIATIDARENMLKASLTPKFAAFAQGFYGNPGLDMFAAMMSHDWTWNAIVGVRMQWNVSSFFTYASDRKKLENARNSLSVRKDIFEYNTNLQSLQQNGDIARMRRAIDSDNEIVDLRTSIRKAAESQLANGVIDTSNLLKRISEETEAVNARNIDEVKLLKTEYELKHTLN